MQVWKKMIINNYQDLIVPKWFYEWFMILNWLKNEIHSEIENILSRWDFFWAKEYYFEKTIDNIEKIWH